WFGVLSMMMVAMGLVFPPVGLIAFIVSATGGGRSHEGLQGNEHPHALDCSHDRAVNDLFADRTMAAGDDAIVVSTHDRRPGPRSPDGAKRHPGDFPAFGFAQCEAAQRRAHFAWSYPGFR